MKKINVRDAEGYELCHDITQILPGQFKGAKFLRGHIIRKEDIEVLISLGKVCAACIKSERIACAVAVSVPGALPTAD